MEIQSIRKRKSEPLEKQERKALKNYRKRFDTEVACAIAIGVDRTVLNAVLLKGSGSPDTISKIREALSRETEPEGQGWTAKVESPAMQVNTTNR